jgi:coenzyme F420-reducing hydrogenase beta subunit
MSKFVICSECGLCENHRAWPAKESIESCVFKLGWLGEQEEAVFGRERYLTDADEVRFGISKRRMIAELKNPIEDAQWSGIITRIALRAFESKLVEGVITLHRSKADYFFPEPVLAQSAESILAGRGNKTVLSPSLQALQYAYNKGVRKLLVIGASCHVHVLRDFKRRFPYLADMELYIVGIPCTDNVKPRKLRWILERISDSHQTVRHYEFMADFIVHLKHEGGRLEKIPYFSLPQELAQNDIFAESCMSCFDYLNSLADVTIGYIGAKFREGDLKQWVIIRTEKGEELFKLIEHELNIFPEESSGDRTQGVLKSAKEAITRTELGDRAVVKKGRKVPVWVGHLMAKVFSRIGPRGLEFARYSVDFHLIRNYYFVRKNYPHLKEKLVPKNVYQVLKDYHLES